MALELKILQAEHGDCIAISLEYKGEYKNILIDGGPSRTFEVQHIPRPLKIFLNEVKAKNQKIDLLVLTHVDDDHIGGLLAGFNKSGYLTELTEEVWFNSGQLIFKYFDKPIDASNVVMLKNSTGTNTSIGQGIKLEDHLIGKNIWSHSLIKTGDKFERFGCKFKILSPSIVNLQKLLVKWEKKRKIPNTAGAKKDYTESLEELLIEDQFIEDKSIHNGSSLAFIFESEGLSLLLLGDAHPTVVIDSLIALGYSKHNPLKVDYVKISHHGSKANTNDELLTLIACNNFIISTNGNHHGLPNKKTLARIINHFPSANLMFNYPDLINKIFNKQELSDSSFNAIGCKDVITP
ncbi:MBL fold metallo-hydrolase [Moritella sp. 36]|uniref:MBL fold metallo-hydrolase n=1 Tax=Moritella sp. 36 TaxID=2746233 RepID=UPI001BA7AD7C|nr:MBL fold metallo-hydrolase [Moritella sp. 36]QUM90561.1 MBL fold metallo-hydrolase [Moritella sp. 36]